MVDSVVGLIGLVDEVYRMYGEVQTADSIIKNLQHFVKLMATELKRIKSTGLSISSELIGKIKNTMVKLKKFFQNYEGQCLCFAIYNRNDNRDEAEILHKELSSLIQLLQLNMLTPMMGNIEKIFTVLTEDVNQANERKKRIEEKKNLAERLTSNEKKEIQKLLDGGFYSKEIGEKLLEDIAQTAYGVYRAKEETAIIKTSLRYVDEEYTRIVNRGSFDRKRCDAQKDKMRAGANVEELEEWIRPYATQWSQLQHAKKKLRALDDFRYPSDSFKKAFERYVNQLKMAYGLVESDEISHLKRIKKEVKALEASEKKWKEEAERKKQIEAKLVKALEASEKKWKEEAERRKQIEAKLVQTLEASEKKSKELKMWKDQPENRCRRKICGGTKTCSLCSNDKCPSDCAKRHTRRWEPSMAFVSASSFQ